MRAMMSLVPPGGSGTTSVIGRLGNCWADTGKGVPRSAASASAATMMRDMMFSSRRLLFRGCARRLDHHRPALLVAVDMGAVFFRRPRHRFRAVVGQALLHVGRRER